MFENLSRLSTDRFGRYRMNGGLERELRHLRDVGYIEVASIRNIPSEGEDLSVHVKITPEGKNFVAL